MALYKLKKGRILLLGEGDFSFTVAFIQQLPPTVAVTASCLLSRDQLCQLHKAAATNVDFLIERGVEVVYEVDATQLENNPIINTAQYDRIIFNFPHIGGKSNIKKNRSLLRLFFPSAEKKLADGGDICISFCQGQGGTPADRPIRAWHDSWQSVTSAAYQNLVLREIWPFDISDYPQYRSTGFRSLDKKFYTGGAMTYVFRRCVPLIHLRGEAADAGTVTCDRSREQHIIQIDGSSYSTNSSFMARHCRRQLHREANHPIQLVTRHILDTVTRETSLMVTETDELPMVVRCHGDLVQGYRVKFASPISRRVAQHTRDADLTCDTSIAHTDVATGINNKEAISNNNRASADSEKCYLRRSLLDNRFHRRLFTPDVITCCHGTVYRQRPTVQCSDLPIQHEMMITLGHTEVALADGGHTEVALADGGHTEDTLVDRGHMEVALADGGYTEVALGDEGHTEVVLGDEGHTKVTLGDEGHTKVTLGDEGHTKVMLGEGGHMEVALVDVGHTEVALADVGHTEVTLVDEGHTEVTLVDEGHTKVTLEDLNSHKNLVKHLDKNLDKDKEKECSHGLTPATGSVPFSGSFIVLRDLVVRVLTKVLGSHHKVMITVVQDREPWLPGKGYYYHRVSVSYHNKPTPPVTMACNQVNDTGKPAIPDVLDDNAKSICVESSCGYIGLLRSDQDTHEKSTNVIIGDKTNLAQPDELDKLDALGAVVLLDLDMIARLRYQIPDSRLLWSEDPAFLDQFGSLSPDEQYLYLPLSLYPPLWRHDVSFWDDPDVEFCEQRLMDVCRDEAGEALKCVHLMNVWTEPGTGRISRCYRLVYQSYEHAISHSDAHRLQDAVRAALATNLSLEVR